MAGTDPPRIPLVLVTGFLGSGKTTFLERVAARHRDRRIVFLVNEFSPRDVDGERLRGAADAVITVAGGSIFCRCVVTEFLYHLKGIPERFGAQGTTIDAVVVETSGMADPTAAGPLLRETRLDRLYRLVPAVALVDPRSLYKVLHTLPAARAQIQSAATVVLNKIDLCSPAEVEDAERCVRELAPAARILRAVRAEVDVDLFGCPETPATPVREAELAACADPAYARVVLRFHGPADLGALQRLLSGLGDDLYRAKGFVPGADGRLHYVDFSASGLSIGGCSSACGAEPELAVIARGPSGPRVRSLLSGITNAAPLPESP